MIETCTGDLAIANVALQFANLHRQLTIQQDTEITNDISALNDDEQTVVERHSVGNLAKLCTKPDELSFGWIKLQSK